jgi:sarcosine oxidase, subunit alpha
MSGYRLAGGGRIERSRAIRFTFDGKPCTGYAGDTLASALLANGVRVFGRSFKYHRPRGVIAAGSEEPNALVTVIRDEARRTPNLRATQVELYEGLVATSQNRWPSLGFDVQAVNDLVSPLLPAAFYYKTFMWPRAAWHKVYEPVIRRAAGLGEPPTEPDPDRYAQRYAHCDVLIVGAGPAGLAAALSASASGARVVLCDEQAEFGGSLLDEPTARIDDKPVAEWIRDAIATLRGRPGVTLLPRTTAFGYFPHNMIGLNERITEHLPAPTADQPRERLWQVRAARVVIAAGSIERPLVFPGNDRPGVMLASAARTYLNRYGVAVGRNVVLVTGCDAAYTTALDLRVAGVRVALIADIRPDAAGAPLEIARQAGIEVITGATVLGTRGRLGVSEVTVGLLADGTTTSTRPVACDALLVSGGYTPSVHLFSQSRGKLQFDDSRQAYLPAVSAEPERSAGSCGGVDGYAQVLNDGAQAGAAASEAAGIAATAVEHRVQAREFSMHGLPGVLAQGNHRSPSRAFVDFQNDVTSKDLALALREGFESVEHIKRYTTTGMATDQGKTSNMNALAYVSGELGRPIPKVGLTTFRMPYTPVTFGIFAGYERRDLFDPVRTTPTHAWAVAHGAVFEDVGQWKRARYFPRSGEDLHAAVARECQAVRTGVGMFDASTLGKIEVVGPDAATFLARMYVNGFATLPVGRSRYGILLRDDGFIHDDGVVARVADDRFHVTTTTGGAARVFNLMEDYLQTEWPDLQCWLTSTTEQWSVIAVQGPRAREVLRPLVSDIDVSAGALPHLGVATGRICGVPMRLFRMSFTGELGYEVNVPSDYGQAIWEAVHAAGQAHGITPYGTETMHVLRAEKGYIIVGQETDGTVTPDDAGLGWAIAKSKPDFVGKRSLARATMHAPDRKQLVGLLTVDPNVILEEGAQVVATPGQRAPMKMIGHVTSSYHSAVLGRSIALALVRGGRARIGETLYVPMPAGEIAVKVTGTVFYDSEGARLHG